MQGETVSHDKFVKEYGKYIKMEEEEEEDDGIVFNPEKV